FPCQLTGIEDLGCFSWEEYYTFGPGSKKEYEQLKKKRASYTDTYELLGFEDEVDPEDGILVHVRRLSDKKKFTLTLSDLASRQFWSKNVRYLVQFAGHLTQESFLGYGGSSRHSRHHSGEDRRLCVMPHAVPSPCGRVGVAPPPRPSVDDAAYEDRLMVLRCLV